MNTTNTNESIEPKERQKGTLFVADLEMREYFAAKAMQGFLACDVKYASDADMIARDAYVMADAMLKAREQ